MCLEKELKKKKIFLILRIRSYRGGEFINHSFITYCEENEIKHELSCSKTPQQNRVVERKNRTLQEMARTMISVIRTPSIFMGRGINTSCYIEIEFIFVKTQTKLPLKFTI